MSQPLTGVGVWVTRPRARAQHLCRLVAEAGGVAYGVPVMQIAPLPTSSGIPLGPFDGVIVVSSFAAELGLTGMALSKKTPIYAVGRATAHTVQGLGFENDIIQPKNFSTEGLLGLPGLQQVADQQWLIIKGKGGRPKLAQTLRQRGATVVTMDVYERQPAETVPSELIDWLVNGKIKIITVTSTDIFKHLLHLIPDDNLLNGATFIVPSERVADYVAHHHPAAEVLRANSALDEDMLACMINPMMNGESSS